MKGVTYMKQKYALRGRDVGVIGVIGTLLVATVMYIKTNDTEYTPSDHDVPVQQSNQAHNHIPKTT